MPAPHRKLRPRVRQPGAAYFVTWNLARGQTPLTPAERDVVMGTIRHFDGVRYDLEAAVVMDDHVHVVVAPRSPWELDQITHSWRTFAATSILRNSVRPPPLWLRDGYDRVALPEGELREKVGYVLRNPWRRWPDLQTYVWVWVREVDPEDSWRIRDC